MLKHTLFALALAALAVTGLVAFEGKQAPVKSGPQVEEELAGPFHPLNVTGSAAGKKNCLFCSNGENPVAMVFAREATPAVANLLKKIDAATQANEKAHMGSYAVFCSDEAGLEKKLSELAEKNGLKKCVLAIDNPAGPKGYNIAKDADITVVLYVERTAKANFAFRKGELTDKDADKIVADLVKILPKK
jgi:hypothetical protein